MERQEADTYSGILQKAVMVRPMMVLSWKTKGVASGRRSKGSGDQKPVKEARKGLASGLTLSRRLGVDLLGLGKSLLVELDDLPLQ